MFKIAKKLVEAKIAKISLYATLIKVLYSLSRKWREINHLVKSSVKWRGVPSISSWRYPPPLVCILGAFMGGSPRDGEEISGQVPAPWRCRAATILDHNLH